MHKMHTVQICNPHLAHVALEALIVLQDLSCLFIAAPEAVCKCVNVGLGDLLVQVSVVLVQILKVLASHFLRIIQIASLVIHPPPAYWQQYI